MPSNHPTAKINFSRATGYRAALALSAVCFLLGGMTASPAFSAEPSRALNFTLEPGDSALLEEIQFRAFRYFDEQTDPDTGLTRDRAPADGGVRKAPASIAATGFALSAWCIADQRGWLPRGEARRRVQLTLGFVATKVPHEHGWIYHYVDAHTGARAWKSEASTIDTALFLQGALGAREYF